MIYCQDAVGMQAENSTDVSLAGTSINIENHPGFEVLGWDEESMLWRNNHDNTTYLLVRR